MAGHHVSSFDSGEELIWKGEKCLLVILTIDFIITFCYTTGTYLNVSSLIVDNLLLRFNRMR